MPGRREMIPEEALEFLLENEGGFSNHKADRGGATKYGITRKTLSKWRGRQASIDEVRALEPDEAKAIYEKWYWRELRCQEIENTNVAICLFDIGVVCGPGAARRLAERVCQGYREKRRDSGIKGWDLISDINKVPACYFIGEFSGLAEERFRGIVRRNPNQKVFERGWIRRARRLLTLMAPCSPGDQAEP